MCGIAGIAGPGATDIAALERMATSMIHRGPDGQGVWSDERIGLAFRRLAIIDLHERSNQPMHLGDLHMVFNGEIYNYLELREELRNLGHGFVTEGDAEVLLHAWAQWGEQAMTRFNGMFALAVWDATSQQLTLATDRFAEKPLFFHDRDDRLIFGSDVRAIRAADPDAGVPDQAATDRFLAFGVMPTLPATFFADVRRLPPSHLLRWAKGKLELERWWTPRRIDVPTQPQAAARQLGNLLRESVRLRLRSDVPVGTSLSGGVDSSTVVALSSELAREHTRHAFTAAFEGFERDEWAYAEVAAETARVGHHHAVRPTADELLDDLPRLVSAQEEPFGSTSIYAQWRVMRAAREAGVVVLLDGQGADELFGGYQGIEVSVLQTLGRRAMLGALVRDLSLARTVGTAYGRGLVWAIARRAGLGAPSRYVSPYVDPELAHDALRGTPLAPDLPVGGSPLRRELLAQTFRTSLPDLCRFADRDSMAFGVEVRLPFLDPGVAEFALSLPTSLVWEAGVTKRVLRDAVRGVVPDVVLDRRDKVGYEPPEKAWFATESVRQRVADIALNGTHSRGIIGKEIVRDLASGAWRDTRAVWRVVNVELWLAEWQTRTPASVV
jgi:asparagine synthase (glutamine-hydrolysing)